MDTSEQYIKMCDSDDVQVGKSNFSYYDSVEMCVVCKTRAGNCISHPDLDSQEHRLIWLPRQDQLQEMVGETFPFILNSFHDYALHEACEVPEYPTSMEQLWLAFVMKENHNKVWENGEWKIIVGSAH